MNESVEKLGKLKAFLNSQFAKAYNDLIHIVRHLPIAENMKNHAFMNLDQGSFWVTQGINLFNVNVKESENVESPQEAAPVQEAPQDAVQKEEVLNESEANKEICAQQEAGNGGSQECSQASQEGQAA